MQKMNSKEAMVNCKITSNIQSMTHSRVVSYLNGNSQAVENCYDNFENTLPRLAKSEIGSVDGDTFAEQYKSNTRMPTKEKPWYVDMFNFFFLCEMCEESNREKQLAK